MKKQRFTEEQIIAVLKEQEAGAKAADLCRKHGISEATFTIGRPNTVAWKHLLDDFEAQSITSCRGPRYDRDGRNHLPFADQAPDQW